MKLNIKNLFKKICVLGASATMALGLCAPLANAAAPNNNIDPTNTSETGLLMNGTIDLYGNTFKINAIYRKGLKVAQSPVLQQVFESVEFKDTGDITIKSSVLTALQENVYLRVKKNAPTDEETNNDTDVPTGETRHADIDSGWVKVKNITSAKVKNAGTYNVYYYVDDLSSTDANGMSASGTTTDHKVTEKTTT